MCRWMAWMGQTVVHNGFIADFHRLRRDLMLAIEPSQFADVQGSTDTEVVSISR